MGIYVNNMAKMYDFYTRVMGFQVSDDGIIRGIRLVFLTRDANDHHQIVLAEGRPDEIPFNVVNQMSFRAGSLDDLRDMTAQLAQEGITEVRQTSHGIAWSIYFLDPEENRIEIFVDSPWYINQPAGEPIDLSQSDAEIMAATETHARTKPEFEPLADWQSKMTKTIDDAAP
ncbi:MAG: catechol-2,3-dioxygenase [Alphaproteobacteria bacterium]|jgi:catechol-2,3-dioxygenase